MRKRIASCLLGVVTAAVMCVGCNNGGAGGSASGGAFNPADYPLYVEDYDSVLYSEETYGQKTAQPYWLGNMIYNELALPFSYENGEAYAKLLYAPLKVVSVMDQTLKKTYAEGTDYIVDEANGRLTIPEGSTIPLLSELADTGAEGHVPDGYELSDSGPDNYTKYVVWNLGTGDFVYTESSYFYGKYLSVTYAYDPARLPKDVFNVYDATYLMKTRAKLTAGEDISLAVIGDSITDGSSSTGDSLKVEPYTPSYTRLLKNEIERVYGVNVTYTNSAKGGTRSEWPLSGEGGSAFQKTLDAVPDLCVIAYGMNDSTASPATSPFAYQTNIENMILQIKAVSPDCEFILVNSFPCNPLYAREVGIFDKYLAKLKELENKYDDGSVKTVDMQAVGNYFLQTKKYCEISSSNVNHPNDFMHRVYAMNLMTAITDYKK